MTCDILETWLRLYVRGTQLQILKGPQKTFSIRHSLFIKVSQAFKQLW